MGRGQSQTLTDYPELDASHESPSSSRLGNHAATRTSRMGHVMTSIRSALAHEQERIFNYSEADFHEHGPVKSVEQPTLAYGQDKTKSSHSNQRRPSEASDDFRGSISPAIEACKSFEANENNMGPDSHQRPATWGWPGLGMFTEYEKNLSKAQNGSKTQKGGALEPRFEAATFEAIDNAADSEPFGWPGLGMWPRSTK